MVDVTKKTALTLSLLKKQNRPNPARSGQFVRQRVNALLKGLLELTNHVQGPMGIVAGSYV